MSADLLVIVPSRGRPESVAKVCQSWRETGAYEHAQLVFVIDADDPRHEEYFEFQLPPTGGTQLHFMVIEKWAPMVEKLNLVATAAAGAGTPWRGIAFMGDDHLPRTPGWPERLLAELGVLRTGIVYGRDGIQDKRLPTWWAMTPDIIRALGAMVPADVEHLYCDNAIKDLGQESGALSYLPEVLIEHMHPIAGKGRLDEGYVRVNRPGQYATDSARYQEWRSRDLANQAKAVRKLREAHSE